MILKYFKLLFNTKIIFKPPAKNDVLIYDKQSEKIISKIFNIKKVNFLKTRKEEINLIILIITFLKFQFRYFDYLINYINFTRAKVVITSIDNDQRFYRIKSKLSVITIFFQNGQRTGKSDIFEIFEDGEAAVQKVIEARGGRPSSTKKKIDFFKKNYFVDLMCVFNTMTAKLYKKIITGEVFVTGSILNNNIKISKTINNNLVFISLFRSYRKQEYFKNQILLSLLETYCEKNNLKLSILAKHLHDTPGADEEKKYYEDSLGKEFLFFKNYKNRNTYKIIDEAKIVVSPGSTLGIEALGRKQKTVILGYRANQKFYRKKNFGFFTKKGNLGPFWYNGHNKKTLYKLINQVRKYKKNKWERLIKKHDDETSLYDFHNRNLKLKLINFLEFKKIKIKNYLN
jgi:hypothetical protein